MPLSLSVLPCACWTKPFATWLTPMKALPSRLNRLQEAYLAPPNPARPRPNPARPRPQPPHYCGGIVLSSNQAQSLEEAGAGYLSISWTHLHPSTKWVLLMPFSSPPGRLQSGEGSGR